MKKKRRRNYTKAEIRKLREYENPDFTLKIAIVTYDDLKKWNLMDSKTFKRKIRQQIKKDFEGGNTNE